MIKLEIKITEKKDKSVNVELIAPKKESTVESENLVCKEIYKIVDEALKSKTK